MTTSTTSPYQDGTDYTELGDVASDAEAYRDQAAASAASAATSATAASSSQSAASTSASSAANSATSASTSATSASGSASSASTSATNASTSATNAGNSATAAAGSASTASTQATNASNSATAAAGSATSASGSASTATTQAMNAGNSATAAAGSATSAGTSATNASNSATAAAGSASTASTQAGNASTSATNASNSASAASTSATNANTYAGNASTSATNASNSATAAATSATNASTSATNAATSETNAANYAAKVTGTSTTSLTIGTGSKVFTTQSGKDFNVGTSIYAIDNVDTSRYMFGTITAYSGTSLTVNVVATNNSGTYGAWNLYGRSGPQGQAAAGTGDVAGPAGATAGNVPTFNGGTGKIIQDSGKAAPSGAFVGTTDTQTLTNKTLGFGTGSSQAIAATSANTGFLNDFRVANSGTGSTSGTASRYTLDLSTVSNGYGLFQLTGGATPAATLQSGSGITGGLTISALAGPLAFQNGGGTQSIPTATDTLVGRATTDTLTNKTLTAPVIATISNTGTLTLPTSTDTLVGRATTDTLTNKTLNSATNTLSGFNAAGSDIAAATSTTKFNTPKAVADSLAPYALTDGATISWAMSSGLNAKVTLGGNRTLATPTAPIAGFTYTLEVIQDATGSRTLTFPSTSIFDFGGSGAPTLSTTASKSDFLTLYCKDAATPTFKVGFMKGT